MNRQCNFGFKATDREQRKRGSIVGKCRGRVRTETESIEGVCVLRENLIGSNKTLVIVFCCV